MFNPNHHLGNNNGFFNGMTPNLGGMNWGSNQPMMPQSHSVMSGINSGAIHPNTISPMNYNMVQNNTMIQPMLGGSGLVNNNNSSLIQSLKNLNYTNWESELFKFYYGQTKLFIFPKMDKIRNLNYLSQILTTHLTTIPLNCITCLPQENAWVINGFQIFNAPPSDNEIIQFCHQMKEKNIFLDLNKSNFIYTPIGIFIKNPDCFLPRPILHNSFLFPKCPCLHHVLEDFLNGIHSEDKLYWCPTCGRHYHQSEIDFSHIKQFIEEVK
ncbi:MAG: hypothetical protein ACRDA0_03415 [Cetobacterium sp.]|uniref:hypothetical protein n=1 Tax=Cetobacterium sp. TaxID=2071632 RepID=UPI003F33AAAE